MRQAGILISLILLCAGTALAAPAASEASGKVVDADGNPLAGVHVNFSPVSSPETVYDTTTNKKGRYFVAGLFSPQGDEWNIAVEADGLVPTHFVVESRTVNRVLVGDIWDKELRPDAAIPSIIIRPMGTVKIDFTLTPADQIAPKVTQQPTAVADKPAAPKKPQSDDWQDALRLAADGDLAGALPLLDAAVKDEPDNVERRETLAKVLYQLKRYDEAEAQARRAVDLAPDKVEPRMVLYSSYMARGDLDSAREVLEAAHERDPQNVQVLGQLGYVAVESGRDEDAVAIYEQLVGIDPENTEAWLNLADLYAAAGRNEDSEAAYQKVADLDPANAHQVFYNLGALKLNKPDRTDADTRQAISAFRKALEINPDYAQAHKQLAFALLGVGQRTEAKGELQKYVDLAPDAPDVAQMRRMIETLGP